MRRRNGSSIATDNTDGTDLLRRRHRRLRVGDLMGRLRVNGEWSETVARKVKFGKAKRGETAQLPDGATAGRRRRQTAQAPDRASADERLGGDGTGMTVPFSAATRCHEVLLCRRRRFLVSAPLWRLRRLASARSGVCAVWRLRGLALAPSGACAVGHLRLPTLFTHTHTRIPQMIAPLHPSPRLSDSPIR